MLINNKYIFINYIGIEKSRGAGCRTPVWHNAAIQAAVLFNPNHFYKNGKVN